MQTFSTTIDQILAKKVAFLVAFFVFFTITYALLAFFDLLPEPIATDASAAALTATTTKTVTVPSVVNTAEAKASTSDSAVSLKPGSDALPIKMTFDTLNRSVTILNPASRDNALLDAALLRGVIRHPDSATLKEEGNLFILGHSSYLPTVQNRNFQAFNGIQTLKWGDTIRVFSSDTEYVYRVEKVYKAQASTLTVPTGGKGHRLTLATCNSFGSKDDRYIVEASLQATNKL